MRLAGRVSAAIDILAAMERFHQPATIALSEWGRANRFAGSSDRAIIGNIVHDALRWKSRGQGLFGATAPRAQVLGGLHLAWGLSCAELAGICDGGPHAPAPLSDDEVAALSGDATRALAAHDVANVPEWLWPHFEAQFGDDATREALALCERAPLDLRVNTLKADREKALRALGRCRPSPTKLSPLGLRLSAPVRDGRQENITADAAYRKGYVEIQDEGSQVAAMLSGAEPGMQVLDLCAGGGGKTLALAAQMENRGQVHAHDADKHRLAPIYDRLQRASVRNVQVRAPGEAMSDLEGKMDRVVVDAPCTGTGVWRRRPDAKWRIAPEALAQREREQAELLAAAKRFVRPGGEIVYITCSLLAPENQRQVEKFLVDASGFEPVDLEPRWVTLAGGDTPMPLAPGVEGKAGIPSVLLSPARSGTDGFFIAVLRQTA